MRSHTLYLSIALFALLSCGNDDDVQPPTEPICMENYNGPLDILWSAPIHPDTLFGNSIHPVIYEEHVLFSKLWLNADNIIYSLNPDTGERQWEWSDLPYVGEVIDFNNPTQGYGDKFYFNYGNEKILIDINEPSTIWSSHLSFSNDRNSAGNSYLYAIQYYDQNNNGVITHSELLRVKKGDQPGWESVFYQEGNGLNRIGFDPPIEWGSPIGDTIAVFVRHRAALPTVSDLVAYNMTQDKISWEINQITEIGESSRHLPILHGDLAYITNVRTISCVDLTTGTELWETEDLETGFSNCAPILADDKIIVNGDSGKLRGINLIDGSVAWSTDYLKFGPVNMAYWKGGIYFCNDADTDSYFFGVDSETGFIFHQLESPNIDCKPFAEMSYGVSIDQATGRLYTLDGYFAMCIQLEPQ